MIFLRISCEKETAIERIAEALLKERLVIDVNVKRNIERWCLNEEGSILKKTVSLLTCKSKGLLFKRIDERIVELTEGLHMEIYSVPIVHMDWEDTQHLLSEVVDV